MIFLSITSCAITEKEPTEYNEMCCFVSAINTVLGDFV